MTYCPRCESDVVPTTPGVCPACASSAVIDLTDIIVAAEKRGADRAIAGVREWANIHLKLCNEMAVNARKRYDYLALERWEGSATTIRVLLESIGGEETQNG